MSLPHNWVEVRVLPVTLELEGDKLIVTSSPEAEEIANDDVHYICYDCKADPRNHELYASDCPGANREPVLDDM